jgi:hypothetical protein
VDFSHECPFQRTRGLSLFSRSSPKNLPLSTNCTLSTQINPMNLFGPFVTSIMPSSLAGKPGRRSYRRLTLSMTGNANWRSLTCSLLCFDCVEIASADSNRPLTILRRFLQPAYFFECDAEASFLLSQVSYSYILILVGLSLTLRLAPGSSLSRGLRTWSDFLMLIQKSPVIYQLRSVDSNQPNELVRSIRDLHRAL